MINALDTTVILLAYVYLVMLYSSFSGPRKIKNEK